MKDGYFRLVNTDRGYGLKIVKARDGGRQVKGMDITAYLDREGIGIDISALKTALLQDEDALVEIGEGTCPAVNEDYSLFVGQDKMTATVRFQAPSPTGKRVELNEVLADLRVKKIIVGIQMSELQEHFQSEGIYDRELIVAKGKPPRQGKDAEIEYFFNTDRNTQPAVNEDGSVDYFQLNIVNHCRAGQVLAVAHPADPGEEGRDVFGGRIRPREVKDKPLKFGNLITLSEDKLSITSQVDGHVMLVDDRVFVSDVFVAENVDLSTGNIQFVGSVQVNGNVKENMKISAGGNVIIGGVVEGAQIEAGGNIIISRGMKGMFKGSLKAGGNVVVKFLENTTVAAEGYVNTESILYSNVSAGTDVIVTGKKGFITGGHILAGHLISVKNLGADMGNSTVVEVGISPALKSSFLDAQKTVADLVKKIRSIQPVLVDFAEKRKRGVRFTKDQLTHIAGLDQQLKELTVTLNQKSAELKSLQEQMDCKADARVEVLGLVCAGTTVMIGEASFILKSEYRYCKFEGRDGEVKMLPLGR